MTTPRTKPGKTPAATPNPVDPASEERQPYAGRRDPDTYARLSRPWPSKKAADAAISAFFEEAHELRVKHGIADVCIIAAVRVTEAGQETTALMSHHSGDSRRRLPMVASTFRGLREQDREEWLEMAGLLSEPALVVTVVHPSSPSEADPVKPTPKESDLARCIRGQAEAQRDGSDAGDRHDSDWADRAGRSEENWRLAIRLHDGDEKAKATVRQRLDLLSGYLMLRGGTNFLATCRAAVAEQRWGDLMLAIGELEADFVGDGTFRWGWGDDDDAGDMRAIPTGKVPESRVPATIDPGGPLP
jgi:hypothetical protein